MRSISGCILALTCAACASGGAQTLQEGPEPKQEASCAPARCGELAHLTKDRAAAVALHQQACEGGEGRSCFVLGSVALSGGDLEEAKRLFSAGCEMKEASACQLLEEVAAYSAVKAEDCAPGDAAACEELCALGSAKSCAELARLLEAGEEEKQDILRAVRFHEVACAQGEAASCAALGRRFLAGDGVPADVEQARKWLGIGCSLGDQKSCELARGWGDR